jgi:D-3-phosphoglycerate dehydrogenase
MKNCLIVDDLHPIVIEQLEAQGIDVHYDDQLDRQGIIDKLPGYESLLVRSKTYIDAEILDAGTELKFIGRAGAGLDQIDIPEVEKRGIYLVGAPEGNQQAVGEQTVGMLLSLMNNLRRADQEVRDLVWRREENRGWELSACTVGIIGYGCMGKAFAKCLRGFGCEVIAYDRDTSVTSDGNAEMVSLEVLQKKADVVSLHIPLDDANHHFAGEPFFSAFEKPIWFVNLARGKVLDTQSLIFALDSGKVLGAALDVLENEKMKALSNKEKAVLQNLFDRDNVLFSPHIGGWTFESLEKISRVLAEKLISFSAKK